MGRGTEMRQSARGALQGRDGDLLLTPGFPDPWPPRGDRDAGLIFLAYESEPLPTGEKSSRIVSPSGEVHVAADPPYAASLAALAPYELGIERRRSSQPIEELDEACDRLVGLLRGEPDRSAAARVRRAYGTWLEEHPLLAGVVAERFPAFAAWVQGAEEP